MTKGIIAFVAAGVISGYFWLPQGFIDISENLMMIGLCIMLFFIGMDLGAEGTVISNIKKVGVRVLLFPLATVLGTYAGVLAASPFLSITPLESLMVGSGFGWYSLAPIIISSYSAEVSAISFLHNVMRELFGIILIPIVAKYIGYVECTCLPGSAAMDVCLPVVEKATKGDIVVYSFVSGVVLSILVPVLVQFFISLA